MSKTLYETIEKIEIQEGCQLTGTQRDLAIKIADKHAKEKTKELIYHLKKCKDVISVYHKSNPTDTGARIINRLISVIEENRR